MPIRVNSIEELIDGISPNDDNEIDIEAYHQKRGSKQSKQAKDVTIPDDIFYVTREEYIKYLVDIEKITRKKRKKAIRKNRLYEFILWVCKALFGIVMFLGICYVMYTLIWSLQQNIKNIPYNQPTKNKIRDMDQINQIEKLKKNNLIPARRTIQVITKNGIEPITVDGYQLEDHCSFFIRRYKQLWVLSIGGRMITYGSYNHISEVITLIANTLTCWKSETSLVYFMTSSENLELLNQIVELRNIDHTMKEEVI